MRTLEQNELIKDTYRIASPLDSGGMGQVYIAVHEALGLQVCVKTLSLKGDFSESTLPSFKKRFAREARAVARLKHANVVTLLDYGVIDDTPFMVMEFFRGAAPVLAWGHKARPSVLNWLHAFRQLFSAVHHAHTRGILHRDIKSGNVLIRGGADSPELCLIDFGVALDAANSALTQAHAVVGSTGNVDPAKLRDINRPYTPQSDLYAAGVLMYQALCGRKPVEFPKGIQPAERFEIAARNEILAPREANPSLSEDIERFLCALLATDPAERPPSGDACVAAIDALIDERPLALNALRELYPAIAIEVRDDGEDEDDLVSADLIVEPSKPRSNNKTVELTKPDRKSSSSSPRGEPSALSVAVPESKVSRVALPDNSQPKESAAHASSFVDRIAAVLAETPKQSRAQSRSRLLPISIVSILLLATLTYAATQSKQSKNDEQNISPPLVTAAELEHPQQDTKPALDRMLAKQDRRETPPSDASLAKFHSDIQARYPVDGETPPIGASPPARRSFETKPSNRSEELAPKKAPPPPEVSLSIVQPVSAPKEDTHKSAPATDDSAQGLSIPHGTKASAVLVDSLDTSSQELVRAELRGSLRIGDRLVFPAGTLLIGRTSLKNNRAQVSFERAVLQSGEELTIRAAAITKDGRDGIAGGQFEYGDDPENNTGQVVAEVGSNLALEVASAAIPGADALSRNARKALTTEATKSRHIKNEKPLRRDRITMTRGTVFTIQFRGRN